MISSKLRKQMKVAGYNTVWDGSSSVIICKSFGEGHFLGFSASRTGSNISYYVGYTNLPLFEKLNEVEGTSEMGVYSLIFYNELDSLNVTGTLKDQIDAWITKFESDGNQIVQNVQKSLQNQRYPTFFSTIGRFGLSLGIYYGMLFKLAEGIEVTLEEVDSAQQIAISKMQKAMAYKFEMLRNFISNTQKVV